MHKESKISFGTVRNKQPYFIIILFSPCGLYLCTNVGLICYYQPILQYQSCLVPPGSTLQRSEKREATRGDDSFGEGPNVSHQKEDSSALSPLIGQIWDP